MKKWRVSWLEGRQFTFRYYVTLKSALKKRVKVGFLSSRLDRLMPLNSVYPKGRYLRVGGTDCFMGFKKGTTFNRYLKEEGFESFEDVLKFVNQLERKEFRRNE